MTIWIIFEVILIILLSLIGLFFLILGLVWVFLPYYFRYSYAKNYDGSYDPKEDKFITETLITTNSQSLSPKLDINLKNGAFSINFGINRSFVDGRFIFYEGNKTYTNLPLSSNEVQLFPIENIEQEIQTNLGNALEYSFTYQLPNSNLKFTTSIISISSTDSIIFRVQFSNELARNELVSINPQESRLFSNLNPIFPVFKNESPNKRIFAFRDSVFCPPQRDFSYTHGPIVLFDDEANSVLLSPLNNFFTSGLQKTHYDIDRCEQIIGFGIHRSVSKIPNDRSYNESIMLFDHGINHIFEKWGNIFRQYHNLLDKTERLQNDLVVNYLGYYTDNGAHYYYNTEKDKTGDQTLELIEKHAQSLELPFHYYHLDSWWYQKTNNKQKQKFLGFIASLMGGSLYGGTLLWEPDPKYIQRPLSDISKQLKKPFSCHNRWFEKDSPYVSKFKFHIENKWAMPDDPAFWEHIMKYCADNNIIVYEQDWMSNVLMRFNYFSNEIGKAEEWLHDMATAAEKHNISIQYCMERPACLLYSMFLPAVTHCRTCDDYHGYAPHNYDIPGFTQTNILANAVGLRPFKDVFKTTKRGRYRGERNPKLMTLMAALSRGPVAPGDQIGYMNSELIMRTCQKNGKLLQPDRPITATDLVFIKNNKYYVASAQTQIGNLYWFFIVTINLFPDRVNNSKNFENKQYMLSELGVPIPFIQYIEYDWYTRSVRIVDMSTLISQNLSFEQYKYRIYAPILESGIAIIGEYQKFTSFSQDRFSKFETDETHVSFIIVGSSEEVIDLSFYFPHLNFNIFIDGVSKLYQRDVQMGIVSIEVAFHEKSSVTLQIQSKN